MPFITIFLQDTFSSDPVEVEDDEEEEEVDRLCIPMLGFNSFWWIKLDIQLLQIHNLWQNSFQFNDIPLPFDNWQQMKTMKVKGME